MDDIPIEQWRLIHGKYNGGYRSDEKYNGHKSTERKTGTERKQIDKNKKWTFKTSCGNNQYLHKRGDKKKSKCGYTADPSKPFGKPNKKNNTKQEKTKPYYDNLFF